MVTKTWKVYGATGHRQRESFAPSYRDDFSNETDGTRIIEVDNSDKTGTNDYSIVRITRDTAEECEDEFVGQLSDGIFENSRTGKIEEVFINRIYIIFEGGKSRYYAESDCVYMLGRYTDADGDGQELYAEVPTFGVEEDDDFGYDELKAEIIKQAKEAGIDEKRLDFPGKNWRIDIIFEGGESLYYEGSDCVYMLGRYTDADGDGQELYAEVPTFGSEEDDDFGYDELKAEIIKQAKEAGIDEKWLDFPGKNWG